MFYAEYHPYGIYTDCDSDQLMQFDTRTDRDYIVDQINDASDDCNPRAIAVTTREARRRYNLRRYNCASSDYFVTYERAKMPTGHQGYWCIYPTIK